MDIFVSYAHVDNQLLSDSTKKGWITHFVNKLRTLTNGKMGREENYTLWKDFRLQGNDAITPEIEEQLKSTQSFILFLSPGWIASDWCQKELKIFQREHKDDIKRRIFVIELESLQADVKPDILRDLKGYRFWLKNDEDKIRRLGFPVPQDTDTEYYDRLVDLSNDVAKILKTETPTETAAITPKATIYVAPVNDSLYRQRESLICELNQYQIAVLPHNNTFRGDMKKDLAECSHFVQLLDSDSVMGIPQQQYQTAKEVNKPILQWRDPTLNFSDDAINAAQKTLLEGKTVIAAALPDFVRMVREAVLPKPKPPKEEIPASNTGKKTIFVYTGREDIEQANNVVHILKQKKYGIALPSYTGKPKEVQASIERGYKYCDILLVLQQKTPAENVNQQLEEALDKITQSKRNFSILICHSHDAESLSFFPPGVLTLECHSNFHEHCLDQFLRQVEA